MVELQASPTELTTAATDLLLGVLCGYAAWRLARGRATFRGRTWFAVFVLLAGASLLGALVHGLRLPGWLGAALWHPLYLALGLAAALVLVAARHDAAGEAAARRWRGPLLALGVLAYLVTVTLGGAFILFVLYEAAVTLAALALYARLAVAGRLPGAGAIALGLVLNLVAAALQATDLELEVIFKFDHNGLFHIILMPAFWLFFVGASRTLRGGGAGDGDGRGGIV